MDGLEGSHQTWKYRRGRDGDVVGAEDSLNLRRQSGKSTDRGTIGFEIGFGTVQPDGPGIIGVTREEQAVRTIEKRNGVRRVAWRSHDFQPSPAQIDAITVMLIRRDLPGWGRVSFGIKPFRELATNLIGREFGLRVLP